MMDSLSSLVKSFYLLINFPHQGLDREINIHDDQVKLAKLQFNSEYHDMVTELEQHLDIIKAEAAQIYSGVERLKHKVYSDLQKKAEPYCVQGPNVVGPRNVTDTRMLREIALHNDAKLELLAKIRMYTDSRFPVLEIGPGDGQWTSALVAGDPLYLVEQHQEFIDSTLSKFTPEYKNRVRCYLVGQSGRGLTDLSELPQNQFGFVFSCNVFEYFTQDIVKQYLAEIYGVLRPGGQALITYNNTDYLHNVLYVEHGLRSWLPYSDFAKMITDTGFEIINRVDQDKQLHWIEFKKPGILTTIKTHQALGEIIDRTA